MGAHYEFDAIGTHWWLERLDGASFSDAICRDINTYIAEFDWRYSRFRDDSLIAQLAREGELLHPPQELCSMLTLSDELAAQSDGAFSVLVGNDLEQFGYGKLHYDGMSSQAHDSKVLSWDNERVSVSRGTVLDFGGFGKGWMIDALANILNNHDVKQYIVNGGGDMYITSNRPIMIALEHPYDAHMKIGDISVANSALAASSIVKRSWVHNGVLQHHIIDPRTHKPSHSGAVATFVQAKTATIADALATILLIRPDLKKTMMSRYATDALILTQDNFSL